MPTFGFILPRKQAQALNKVYFSVCLCDIRGSSRASISTPVSLSILRKNWDSKIFI